MLGSLLHTERPRPAPQRSQDRQLREGSATPAKTLAQELLLRLSQRPGRLGEAQSPTSPRELESPRVLAHPLCPVPSERLFRQERTVWSVDGVRDFPQASSVSNKRPLPTAGLAPTRVRGVGRNVKGMEHRRGGAINQRWYVTRGVSVTRKACCLAEPLCRAGGGGRGGAARGKTFLDRAVSLSTALTEITPSLQNYGVIITSLPKMRLPSRG